MAVQELLAIVDAVDAEVRLATLGDARARSRARHLAAALSVRSLALESSAAVGGSRHDR
jgi:hypothetical protein